MLVDRWKVLDTFVRGTRLNIGCGVTPKDGWINADLYGSPDLKFDLSKPWPVKPQSIDTIYGSHVLEHFRDDDLFTLMYEAGAALKPGGRLLGVVPYGFTTLQLASPFHKQLFTKETLGNFSSDSFDPDACAGMEQGVKLQPWQVEAVWMSKQEAWQKASDEEIAYAARHYLNVFHEMVFVMRMPEEIQ